MQGDYRSALGPSQKRLQPAVARVHRASLLAERLSDFIQGSVDKASLQEAWFVATKCLKEALSYDVRIIPSVDLQFIFEIHEQAVRKVLGLLAGMELTDVSWRICSCLGHLADVRSLFRVRAPMQPSWPLGKQLQSGHLWWQQVWGGQRKPR